MNTEQRDPIFESLDQLAGIADTDVAGDRMPDIQRRVRVSRQRKGAGVLAAAAVLAVAGVAVWQGLPNESSAPPVTPPPATTPWQKITIDAEAQDTNHLQISYTINGESTAYSDAETGEPIDVAGPAYTELIVDGDSVTGSDGSAMDCKPGGALTPYTLEFPGDGPAVVDVFGAGEHTVVVKAPYCADGEIVMDIQRVVVTTVATGSTIGDQLRTDLDGDGANEIVRIRVPNDINSDQELQVTWGTGETTSAPLPNTMEYGILDPSDLDGDGDLELVVNGGGGETSLYWVFQATTGTVEQVKSVDASGKELALTSTGEDTTASQISYGPDGIRSYQLVDPNAATPPAPAEVRAWTLSGDTLTQSADSTTECVLAYNPTPELGPC
jgi:hypothetical protein